MEDFGDEDEKLRESITSRLKNEWRKKIETNGSGLLGKVGLSSPVLRAK